MPRSELSARAMTALKVLWENKIVVGCCVYTYGAGSVLHRAGLFKSQANCGVTIRKLEKEGFFICDKVGRGQGLEIKWTDKGIAYFGAKKPTLVSMPEVTPPPLPKMTKKPKTVAKRKTEIEIKPLLVTLSKPEVVRKSQKPKIVIPNKTRTEKIGAIFIDWDNLVIPAENDRKLTYEEIFNLLIKTIVEQALKFIDVAHLFIYTSEAHIIINPFFEVYCEEMGFEPIFVPVAKDAADKEIVSKAEELASDQAISTFVFASGDGFFTNTVIKLKEIGKKVVIMPYDRFSLNSVYLWMLDTKKEIIFLKPLMTN
ncbi:MAG: hypothetical protein UV10_C0018G0011 [Candidatus Azambacteria bacterium GW2011_GWA1_42_19]|nr:MAG: hypothetical protein UV10_C0018G0011 [Candidatus Azambacteria bacterium GW2011_GWA1_42_19]